MNISKNFYFRSITRVVISLLVIFLFSMAFSSVSVSSLDESLVKNMVHQKCSNSYTRNVSLDSNHAFENVILFNRSYISLEDIDCNNIQEYEYDVSIFWNIPDLRSTVATAFLSMPILYSLILSTPFLGLYDNKKVNYRLKKYFRFAEINILVPSISLTLFYVLEVLTRLKTSTYVQIPGFVLFLFIVIPLYSINKKKVELECINQNEKKFIIGLALVTVIFWIVRLMV